jgi:hypothetical protein
MIALSRQMGQGYTKMQTHANGRRKFFTAGESPGDPINDR